MNTHTQKKQTNPKLLRGFSVTIALFALLQTAAHAAPLLTETFADGNRTANPAWYWMTGIPGGNRVDTVAANAWTVGDTADTSNGYVVAYFTSTALATGDAITFSFDLSYATATASAGNNLRFGLFNSNGSKVSADGGTSNAAFTANDGYASYYTLQTTTGSAGFSLRERNGENATLWSGTAVDTTLASANSAISAANTTYSASYTITRIASDQLSISSTINGQTINFTDLTPSATSFDMISIYAGGANGELTLSDIGVTYTSAIPEPGTFALLASFGALGFVMLRRVRSEQ